MLSHFVLNFLMTTVPLEACDDREYNFYLVLFLIGTTPIATDIWSDLVKQGDWSDLEDFNCAVLRST